MEQKRRRRVTEAAVLVLQPIFTAATLEATKAREFYSFATRVNTTSLEETYGVFVNCTPTDLDCYNETSANRTANGTRGDLAQSEDMADLILMGTLSVILGLMILMTVIGNVFVIAAILLERNLQNVANYLIVSLAVADLMVACLVMPLGAVYVISNNWIMGPELCDMWTSTDVLCCTASILHLVAIAIDRYWAVTNVDYIHTRNSHRIGVMIVVVWTIALVVSMAPQIPQFKDPDYLYRIQVKKQCLLSQDIKYQIFATSATFYVPLLVIFVVYWKIFQTARKRIRKRRQQKAPSVIQAEASNNNSKTRRHFLGKNRFLRMKRKKQVMGSDSLASSLVIMEGQSTTTMEIVEEETETQVNGTHGEETTAFTITKPATKPATPLPNSSELPITSNSISPEKSSTTNNGSAGQQSDIARLEPPHHQCPPSVDRLLPPKKEKKESIEAKRERKAAKTLAIITGAFVMCWLPFFILALLLPLCGDYCNVSDYIMSFALWLGYFNSTLNPIIYTIFSPEFRMAFKRILCGAHTRKRNFRLGKTR